MAGGTFRRGIAVAAAGAWLALATVVSAAYPDVEMRDFTFAPKTLTIEAGDTVYWANVGDAPHDAVGDGWETELLTAGNSGSVRFAKAGTYDYLCTIHPDLMTGTIVVRGSGDGGGGPTDPPTDTAPIVAATPAAESDRSAVALLLVLAALGGLLVAGRRLGRVRAG